jgi:N-acyl-D-amino-acid deacylase
MDTATYAEPHHYSTGMRHVIVNGVVALADEESTGATTGRFVKGPGYRAK